MIHFLKNWVINIVTVVVFVTFIEILLPNSSMKRYINVIIGLTIIVVLVNPFIKLLTEDIDIEKEVFKQIKSSYRSGQIKKEEFQNLRETQVIGLYKDKVKNDLKNLLDSYTKYTVKDISVEIIDDMESKKFGSLQKVKIIFLNNDKKEDQTRDIKVDPIENIKVSLKTTKEKQSLKTINNLYDIKTKISDAFKIPKENILLYMAN
ncbi:stage III sporulation protein AF [Thermohalobacter berrensis]|uniref:Stage III sporulation protein AF n=1 Tax=Thermohalobacter berrensis TaxID=99594 RepID=A0A419TAU2_9FIRM|nr:stage III sporulation protein AF [Thermohalobacter berrensis]RKD34572.1 stage III sporulation protein AF [Thermohalobacter berrensis]